MSNTVYLNIETSTGNLFEYSKEPKEGFDKHEYEQKDGAIKVSYRRYHKFGIFGRLINITTKDSAIGQQMSICMEDVEGTRYFISFPLFDSKNNITGFSMSVIQHIKGLQEGRAYRLLPYAMEEEYNGKKRKNLGISFRYARLEDNAIDDKNLPPKLTFQIVDKDGNITKEGDIPPIEWETDMDKLVPNMKKRNNYLWSVFKEYRIGDPELRGGGKQVNTFDSTSDEPTPAPKKEAPAKPATKKEATAPAKEAPKLKEEPKAVVVSEEEDADDDDALPF